MMDTSNPPLVINTPIGTVSFMTANDRVAGVELFSDRAACEPRTAFHQRILQQVQDYFAGKRQSFDLPVHLTGSIFQQRLCRALTDIPYGEVKTYGQLAQELKSSAQAIGGACRRNPLPLLIPCHRVVAAHGVGGFSGATGGVKLNAKLRLLQLEQEVNHVSALS